MGVQNFSPVEASFGRQGMPPETAARMAALRRSVRFQRAGSRSILAPSCSPRISKQDSKLSFSLRALRKPHDAL
jgi:hypothetical protein